MKNKIKYTGLIILLFFSFSSCKKEATPAFDQKPQQRMAKTLNALDQELNSGNGWVAYIYTGLRHEGYSFYMTFLGNNRVQMMSDIDNTTATTPKESSYRVKWLEQPSLLFDTYNYIHKLADPMPGSQGGDVGGNAGTGLISDFEFGLTEPTIDTLKNYPDKLTELMTIGRDNSLHVTFHKVSAEEAAFWKGGKIVPYISEVLSFIDGFGAKFPGIEAEPGKFLQISFLHKNTRFYWNQGDSLVTKNLGYAFGMNSLQLEDTVSFNGKHLTGFVWDNNILYAIVDSKKIPVKALEKSVLLPLSEIIGQNNYFSITNSSTALNGTSADFIARRKAANDAMYYGPYNLILDNMEFRFDGSEKTVLLTVYLYRGGTYYLATYQYNYSKTADGIFKFTIDNTKTNGNGNLVEADMAPLLAERFNTDHFKLDYANQQGTMIGQFISVEHPDFTFSGALQ